MSKLALLAIVAASAFQLACGDTTERDDSSRAMSASGLPLGAPFEIVNGVISADSNEYGLQASLAAARWPTGATLEVTSDTGQICMRGELAREVLGPFGGPGAGFSFITGRNVMAQLPEAGVTLNLEEDPHALSAYYGVPSRIVIDPSEQVPWSLGDGRVLGIAATVTGPTIPPGAPGFGAFPGRQNPDELINQYAPACDGSIPPPSGARTIESIFADLHYYCWNTAQLPYSGWTADSTIIFGWGVSGVRVPDTPENANASSVFDPYDFCLSDIRPILVDDAEEPGSIDAICARGCAAAASLGCSSQPVDCRRDCVSNYSSAPAACRSLVSAYGDCVGKRPRSDWECGIDGEANPRAGVCAAQANAAAECLVGS